MFPYEHERIVGITMVLKMIRVSDVINEQTYDAIQTIAFFCVG